MEESTPFEGRIAKQMRILYHHDIILSDGDINVIKSCFFTQSLKYYNNIPTYNTDS
jgi:hypothetical protein